MRRLYGHLLTQSTSNKPVYSKLGLLVPQLGKQQRNALVLIAALLLPLIIFWTLSPPVVGGTDWTIYRDSAMRLLNREPLYVYEPSEAYVNPPWLVATLLPLALLPHATGWLIVILLSMAAALGAWHQWDRAPSPAKALFVLLSPPVLHLSLHGQIDLLVLATVILPKDWWLVWALTKPQVVIGAVAGIPRAHWKRNLVITALVFAISVILLGFWPTEVISNTRNDIVGEEWNIWRNVHPFQMLIGVLILAYGWRKQELKWMVAASPLLSPYAIFASLIGFWIAAISSMTSRQAAVFWAVAWALFFYVGTGG